MTYSSLSVANYFLSKSASEKVAVSPMKLQKLVYYAHGWYLGNTKVPLINESVEAWPYGPVIPTLYHEFKRFGGKAITEKASELNGDFEIVEAEEPQNDDVRRFLDSIWVTYSKFTAEHLSNMTHAEGTPWSSVWSSCGGIRGTDISNELIANYFKGLIDRSKAANSPAGS